MTSEPQTLILVDDYDKFLGYGTREECHFGKGRKHRAFVTALFDKNGRVLLQKRKHELFDGLWDLTAISHPLHLENRDESYQEASDRALKKEMGILHVGVEKVGGFAYFAKQDKNCENEYCAVLTGEYNGRVVASREEVYESKWVEFEKFLEDILKTPKKYTVWAKESVPILQMVRTVRFLGDLEVYKKSFDGFLAGYFSKKQNFAKRYPKLVQKHYAELGDFAGGGKSLRPYLMSLGWRIAKNRPEQNAEMRKILPECLAIELAHNFLLVHDDIIDNSATRRGKPTIHMRFGKEFGAPYGVSQAILAGDLFLLEAFRLFPDEKLVNIWIETVYGQALDVELSRKRATFDEIMQVIDLKTAKYTFVGPLLVGAQLGGMRDASKLKALELFGIYCGRMFQLKDDILGVFGDERETGKSALVDMREGKNTLLIYKTKELASQKMRQDLDALWGRSEATKTNLFEVRRIIEESGALLWCSEEIEKYVDMAQKQVVKITKNAQLAQILVEITGYITMRKS